jgi:hypothetical protein
LVSFKGPGAAISSVCAQVADTIGIVTPIYRRLLRDEALRLGLCCRDARE